MGSSPATDTVDAQQIFDNFHTHATGTGSLGAGQQAAFQLASSYQYRAITIQKLIDDIKSGWIGNAASAAAHGLAPLAENTLQTGIDLDAAQDLAYRQVDSFHAAVAHVRPPPPEPQLQNIIQASQFGFTPDSMLAQIRRSNDIAQSNVDAYDSYVKASQFNSTNLPDLSATMQPPTADVGVVPPHQQLAPPGGGTDGPGTFSHGHAAATHQPDPGAQPHSQPVGHAGHAHPAPTVDPHPHCAHAHDATAPGGRTTASGAAGPAPDVPGTNSPPASTPAGQGISAAPGSDDGPVIRPGPVAAGESFPAGNIESRLGGETAARSR
ncbi:MAG: PPE domain-containing protein, partial [Sciscionella sp.]